MVSSSTGEAAVLEEQDMLPDFRERMRRKSWPYIKQVYSKGAHAPAHTHTHARASSRTNAAPSFPLFHGDN